jgi:hypothetical protein
METLITPGSREYYEQVLVTSVQAQVLFLCELSMALVRTACTPKITQEGFVLEGFVCWGGFVFPIFSATQEGQ